MEAPNASQSSDVQQAWIQSLHTIACAISHDKPERMEQALLEHLVSGLGGATGSLTLVGAEGSELVITAATGSAEQHIGRKITPGQGIIGRVVAERQALLLGDDYRPEASAPGAAPRAEHDRPSSAICWPLLVENRLRGVACVNRLRGQPPFVAADIDRGQFMVNLLAVIVENAQLRLTQQRRIVELYGVNQELQDKQQKLQAALTCQRESEARLSAVIEGSDAAIVSVDEAGRIVLFNETAESVFGVAASEVLGGPLDPLLPPRFVAGHAAHLQRFAQGPHSRRGKQGRGGIRGRRKNGEEFPAEASISRTQVNGKPLFTVMLRDISERVATEDKLQRLGRILDNTVNEIYIFDADTLAFVQVNLGAQRNLGYTMDELRHMTPLDLKPLYTREQFDKLLGELRQSCEQRMVFETVHRRKDGSLYPVEVRLQYTESEASPAYVAVIEDISERHQAEARTRQLMAMLESTPDLVGTCDTDGQLTFLNHAGYRQLGLAGPQSLAGLRVTDFLAPWSVAQYHTEARPYALRDGSWQGDSALRTSDGREVPVSHLILVHQDGQGRRFLSFSLRDISELEQTQRELRERHRELEDTYRSLKQAQSQLLQNEKLASVGQLAAGVAHEINNPVGYVNSNLGTLHGYVRDLFRLLAAYEGAEPLLAADPARQAEIDALKQQLDLAFLREDTVNLVKESQEGLTRVKKIVQDLKDFSHVDRAEWQEADLHAGLDSTLNIVNNELKYKADIVKDYGVLPPVACIPSQLNQVFMNLLVNAAHAMESRGTITLRTGTEDDGVFVEIRDTGKGMTPEVQKRIFEPFFTTKPVGQGTGLGLSLSYGIVQKHHGRISVASAPGHGTTFRVWVPVRQAQDQQIEPLRRTGT
jgi:PAS domain S-box-containing protein